MCKCSGFSASSPTLVTSFMNNSYTDECGISFCFESHFPNDYWWWASFLVLISHLDIHISSEKCLFKFFVFKKKMCGLFLLLSYRSSIYTLDSVVISFLSLLLSFRALNYTDFKVSLSGHWGTIHFFSLWFISDIFSYYVFKFTDLFFWNL